VQEDDRFLPHLAPERVVGQSLDMFGQTVRIELFDSLDDPGVEGTPALLQEAAVGHLMGERVLEGVLQVREETGLDGRTRRRRVRSVTNARRSAGALRPGLP
jgi:hypothetical protein